MNDCPDKVKGFSFLFDMLLTFNTTEMKLRDGGGLGEWKN